MPIKFSNFGSAIAPWSSAGTSGPSDWAVPEEVPAAFVYNGRNYAVMLTTPDNLEDFAVGFTLTEQIAGSIDDIHAIDTHCSDRGIEYRITLTQEKIERFDVLQKRRNIAGKAGCGVCGLDNAEIFFQTLPRVTDHKCSLDETALKIALSGLRDYQHLNQITKSVHAAAWVNLSGKIEIAREDIGRHNALDKLLGALMRKDFDPANGFVLMSSRCSYELVEKSAHCGVQALASISAPTSFAIRKAAEANMALYARLGDSFVEIRGDTDWSAP